jgi:hypothetical protein
MRVPDPPMRRARTPFESRHPYVGSMLGPAFHDKSEPSDADSETVDGFYDNPTMAMSRDALDVLPGARALMAPKVPSRVGAPIPHFRAGHVATPAAPSPAFVAPRVAAQSVKPPSRAPLAVWIVAAIVVGVISFRFAPEVVARLEPRAVGQQR